MSNSVFSKLGIAIFSKSGIAEFFKLGNAVFSKQGSAILSRCVKAARLFSYKIPTCFWSNWGQGNIPHLLVILLVLLAKDDPSPPLPHPPRLLQIGTTRTDNLGIL